MFMAIKYIILPEKKQVIAVLNNTRLDAFNKALKICHKLNQGHPTVSICPNPEKLMMVNTFKVTITCDEKDEFDVEVGKKIAKERLLRNYYKSFDKKLATFMNDVATLYTNIENFNSLASDDDYEE